MEGAKEAVLHVDFQYGEPCMWYDAIAPDLLTYKYLIVAVETGHFHDEEVLEKGKYIGTAMLLGGSLVLHYFLFEPCVLRKSTLITLAMDDFA